MIRKFNFTGRRRIPRTKIEIRLIPEEQAPSFEARLDLEGLDLPEEAKVFVEAYDKASYMRFPFGEVANISPPSSSECRLRDLQSRDVIFFRVKVVDASGLHGRVLAVADRLPPAQITGTESEKRSLMGVRTASLGDVVWKLDLSGDLPVLELNEDLIDLGIWNMAKSDGLFISLVFPAIVRQVLVAAIEGPGEPDSDDWKGQWLQYASYLGAHFDPTLDESERMQWVDDEAVPAFCKRFRIKERFRTAKSGDEIGAGS